MYNRSIAYLKHLTYKPSAKEWNKIAAENNLLSTISLRRLSGISSFVELYKNVKMQKIDLRK